MLILIFGICLFQYQKKQQELLKQGAKDKLKYQQEKSEQKKKELEDKKKKEIETTMKVQQLLKLSENERRTRVSGDKPVKGRSPSSMKINQVCIVTYSDKGNSILCWCHYHQGKH